jgi:NitT/TauT family transport system substrate-binding protein
MGSLSRRAIMGSLAAGVAGRARAATLRNVTLLVPSAPTVPAFAPLVLAQHLGFYAEAGLEVRLRAGRGGVDVAKEVGVGNAEFGTAVGDTAVIVRANGIPVKVVALLGGGSFATIVARPDRGIHELRDIKGKRVSVLSFQDTTYFGLLGALAAVGLGKGDVSAESVGPAGVSALVLTGDVDACVCVPEREVEIQNALPGALSFPTAAFFPSMAQAMFASDEMIAKDPDLVRAMVGATLRGVRTIMDDPARAAAAYVVAVPSFEGKAALIQQIMERYIERTYRGQARLGAVDSARFVDLQKFMVQQGIVRNGSPIGDLYTNEFVIHS